MTPTLMGSRVTVSAFMRSEVDRAAACFGRFNLDGVNAAMGLTSRNDAITKPKQTIFFDVEFRKPANNLKSEGKERCMGGKK